MHTMYRGPQRQINWQQSKTQFQCCYKFSRCASRAASPTIGDVKSLNKLAREIKSQPVKLQYWPLTGQLRILGLRILGFPDASYRNNDDGSSQRGMTASLAESRRRSSRDGMTYGSLIDYPDVDFYNVSTYQCSILFNNTLNKKSKFSKAEHIDKPISSHEKFNVTNDPQLSLLTEFRGNNYAHMILTAEVDSSPTDA